MRLRQSIFPALSLATLLVACAHDNKPAARAANADEVHAEKVSDERSAQGEPRAADAHEERVDLPHNKAERERLASTGKDLPEGQRERDNTAVNERDRDNAQLTPMDQGNGEVDVDLTQRIRKAVMADDSLSFTAKNAKIITRDGRVTLRGTVKTAAEKETIYKCAVGAAGVGRVSNELEVDND